MSNDKAVSVLQLERSLAVLKNYLDTVLTESGHLTPAILNQINTNTGGVETIEKELIDIRKFIYGNENGSQNPTDSSVMQDITNIKNSLSTIQNEILNLNNEILNLNNEISDIKNEIVLLKNSDNVINENIERIQDDITIIEEGLLNRGEGDDNGETETPEVSAGLLQIINDIKDDIDYLNDELTELKTNVDTIDDKMLTCKDDE